MFALNVQKCLLIITLLYKGFQKDFIRKKQINEPQCSLKMVNNDSNLHTHTKKEPRRAQAA